MPILRQNSGHTLIEALVAVSIMGLITAGAMLMMTGSARCFDDTSTQVFTDSDAVIAMQMIVNDVREAKSINIIAGGERLRVVFPKKTEDGYYDRHEPDMANQIDYYLSNETGVPGQNGTWLWRGKNNNNREPLKKDVADIDFEQDTSRSVKITIIARNPAASGPKETCLTQRVVYLRNY